MSDAKNYKTGYLMGVFDLFHTGHLNLIEKAAERCEKLIVGVLSDEIVEEQKGAPPIVPLGDRMRIISALEAVDQVTAVTDGTLSKVREFLRIGFDCLFSGNDYEDDPLWKTEKEDLEKLGSTIEFFPYTEGMSTTLVTCSPHLRLAA